MARKRRRFTPEFKARVALEALRERDSVQAIAARHELHPTSPNTWPPASRRATPRGRRLGTRPMNELTRCPKCESDHTVQTLLEGASHVHHVFPRNYLKNHGLPRSRYNQIANYVVMQGEINIAIGDNPPAAYFSALWRQSENGEPRYGGITDADDLRANFQAHCIPQGMDWPDVGDYDAFLKRRRLLMAVKIRDYYKSL